MRQIALVLSAIVVLVVVACGVNRSDATETPNAPVNLVQSPSEPTPTRGLAVALR